MWNVLQDDSEKDYLTNFETIFHLMEDSAKLYLLKTIETILCILEFLHTKISFIIIQRQFSELFTTLLLNDIEF